MRRGVQTAPLRARQPSVREKTRGNARKRPKNPTHWYILSSMNAGCPWTHLDRIQQKHIPINMRQQSSDIYVQASSSSSISSSSSTGGSRSKNRQIPLLLMQENRRYEYHNNEPELLYLVHTYRLPIDDVTISINLRESSIFLFTTVNRR